jgi:hypothetical protein
MTTDDWSKIRKLEALAADRSTTDGERNAARRKADELRARHEAAGQENIRRVRAFEEKLRRVRQRKSTEEEYREIYGNKKTRYLRNRTIQLNLLLNRFHVLIRLDGVIELTLSYVDDWPDYKNHKRLLLFELHRGGSFCGWRYADLHAHGDGFVSIFNNVPAPKPRRRRAG